MPGCPESALSRAAWRLGSDLHAVWSLASEEPVQDSVAMPAPAGVLFFGLVLGSGPLTPWLGTLGLTPLMAAVLVGAAQNVFSKSAKYSLFDPCKEMAYIPLDQETQLKGKAAIDVVCNPLVSCPCGSVRTC